MIKRQLILFIIIGSISALIHVLTVALLVALCDLSPLKANILGFLTAFGFSFWHHATFTFQTKKTYQNTFKFFIVAALGFIINQSLYYLQLNYISQQHYVISLIITLLIVPIFTFAGAKIWAFPKQRGSSTE